MGKVVSKLYTGSGLRQEEYIKDGTYTADFNTDSSMFHVNETCDGKGILTVKEWTDDNSFMFPCRPRTL